MCLQFTLLCGLYMYISKIIVNLCGCSLYKGAPSSSENTVVTKKKLIFFNPSQYVT